MTDILRMEKRDREIARGLGIMHFNEGKTADYVLENPEMLALCKGRSHAGVKMMVGEYLKGHELQMKLSR